MAIESATYISQLVSSNPDGSDDRSTADDHLRLIKSVLKAQFPNFNANEVTSTVAELNLLASYPDSTIPSFELVGPWNKQQYFAETTLTDGSNISWDLNTNQSAKVTLGGNRTLSNPTNQVAGGVYTLRIIQDGTGDRTLSYGSDYKFPGGSAPALSTSANAVDILNCYSNGTNMYCTLTQDFS